MTLLLSNWWFLALISGLGLATRNVMFKYGSGHMDAAFGSLILSLSMAIVSVAYFIISKLNANQSIMSGQIDTRGVIAAAVAGAGVAGANIFLAYAYKTGGQASLVAVLQNGFSITVTIIVGMLVLGEIIRPMQALGILLAFGGMVLIARG